MICKIEYQSDYNIGDTVLGEFKFTLPKEEGMALMRHYDIAVIGKVKDIEFDENARCFYYTLYGRILRGCPYREIKIFKNVSEDDLTIIDPKILEEVTMYDPFDE